MGQITADQSQQVMAVLQTNVNWSVIDFDDARLQDLVIRNPKEASRHFTIFLQNGCRMPSEPIYQLAEWQVLYRRIGLELDFSGLVIPKRRKGFNRLILVAKSITPQGVFNTCAKLFQCVKWTEDSLDDVIDFSFQARSAKDSSYAIWVRDRVEADNELKNLSADVLTEKGIPGITLEERLLYEIKYFEETRRHLDSGNVTLCSGSRFQDGRVPGVDWYVDFSARLSVDRYDPSIYWDNLRYREVVS